ncbi:HypC/HybG/HupF family hydrogenase formation chaperone [Nitrosomonas aestuarii]|uniref:Hydrogenase expression/formation protein HypC n=1 Tax=Nitrosomonas aestuarii TaxID=52441 RepID=A0A1I4EBG3_9PROT|nr:HypC/HybG/HupF family hydrogenase formation chaperone [Nitrosomonas aestuarii]PTN12521.1 hydrogenase expression/formation protein HypC [Nitrosomonas aestuarii]SFL03075.1 hydrogenase expression/formation protein HypC [Nitrosomonas aestuarii]|tara:strand:+ start:431 stop:676 length:246 start_codon:yes stop_codon:yes gene_type:complete
MCLAIPALVERLTSGDNAIVNLAGVRKEISLALVDQVEPGDYVIVHVGFALQKLDPDEAEKTLLLFDEMSNQIDENTQSTK